MKPSAEIMVTSRVSAGDSFSGGLVTVLAVFAADRVFHIAVGKEREKKKKRIPCLVC